MTSYPGGKAGDGTFQTIINQIPPHRTLVIPFLGNCGVMRNIRPAETTIGIESNGEVLSRFRLDRQGLYLFHRCGVRWLEMNRLDPDSVIYADPPYLQSVCSKKRIYGDHEMTEHSHERLLRAMIVQSLNGVRCLISGYDSRLYNAVLKGWRCLRYWAATRRGPRLECLWMSFPQPTELHDYQYLGENKRERERIKRKRKRTVRKLMKLAPLERRSILIEVARLEAEAAKAAAGDRQQAGRYRGGDFTLTVE